MTIRHTAMSDVAAVVAIYQRAREFMRLTGNPRQWHDGYPSRQTLVSDIREGGSHVCVEDGRVVASFYFSTAPEPTYAVIENGRWLNSAPYGVVHRAASDGSVKGVMKEILDYCFRQIPNIRIDTHRDNRVMQTILTRYGFRYCGIIHLANGSERLAYQMATS